MARSYEVLAMLRPNGGYLQVGEEFEGITFLECEPLTKEEFEAGFAAYDALVAEKEAAKQAQRGATLAKLEALGLDENDLKALGLG